MKKSSTYRLAASAALIAVLVLLVAVVLVARDGVGSGALIFGVPPVAVASLGCLALYAGTRLRQTWPLVLGLVVEAAAVALAAISFVTPLLLGMAPVCALLIASTATELAAGRADHA